MDSEQQPTTFHQTVAESPPPDRQEDYRREYELQMQRMQRMACYGCGEC